jgi:hypothetical protein
MSYAPRIIARPGFEALAGHFADVDEFAAIAMKPAQVRAGWRRHPQDATPKMAQVCDRLQLVVEEVQHPRREPTQARGAAAWRPARLARRCDEEGLEAK